MTDDPRSRHERLTELLDQLWDLSPEERAQRLATVAPDLRKELTDLLAADDGGTDALRTGWARGRLPRVLGQVAPDVVGDFELLEAVAEGGMGRVYRARQQDPDREVAVKLLTHTSAEAKERLRREARLLAQLDHPGIVEVLASGEVDGVPWLAMPFIDGVPLDERCAQLPVEERVKLMLQVCDAVQHAHGRQVLHRDLKPSNILVDRKNQVRVLDFGVGRDIAAGAAQTRTGAVVGTLAYMSPEQLHSEPVDGRSDVYGLGCVLAEVLSGRRPIDLDNASLPEAIARITEQAPAPLPEHLPRDLAAITAKALRKDPSQRYATVAALADDLRRHLNQEPVLARPPTLPYLFSRFYRRHRAAVLAAAVVVLALLALAVNTAMTLRQVQAERDATAAAHADADQVLEFLSGVLASATGDKLGVDVTVHDAIEHHEDSISETLSPGAQARLFETLGRTHRAWMDYPRASELFDAALALHATEVPATDDHLLALELDALEVRRQSGGADLLPAYEVLLRRIQAHPGADPSLEWMARYAVLQAGNQEDDWVARAEATHAWVLEHEHPQQWAAGVASLLGRHLPPAEALPWISEAVERYERTVGPEHTNTLRARLALAKIQAQLGEGEAARAIAEETVAQLAARYTEGHRSTIRARRSLINLLIAQGEYEAAQAEATRTLAEAIDVLGRDHETTVSIAVLSLSLDRKLGASPQENTAQTQAWLETATAALGPDHSQTMSLAMSVFVQTASEDPAEVRAAVDALLARLADAQPAVLATVRLNTLSPLQRAGLHEDVVDTFDAEMQAFVRGRSVAEQARVRSAVNRSLVALGRTDEALAACADVVGLTSTLSPSHPARFKAMRDWVALAPASDDTLHTVEDYVAALQSDPLPDPYDTEVEGWLQRLRASVR